MKSTLPLFLLAAMLLGIAPLLAQNSPEKDAAKEDQTSKPDAAEKPKEVPAFAKRDELVAHFEAEREALRTKAEVEQKKPKPNPEALHEIQLQFRTIDENNLKALEAYLLANPKAADIGAARYDIVDFAYRLGNWAQCADAATEFLALYAADSKDLTRQASFLRASSLLNIEGKEAEAAKALEAVAKDYPNYFEGNLARWNLVRAYVLANEISKAKTAVMDLLKDDEVRDDQDALRQANALNHALLSIGKTLPTSTFTKIDESDETSAALIAKKQPFILWYWDTRDGLSLKSATDMEALAKEYAGKVTVYGISVNKSVQVWKTHIGALKETSLTHLFEGRLDSPTLSSVQLGVEKFPLAVLVNGDGTIYRFDTPMRDLDRTIKAWLKN